MRRVFTQLGLVVSLGVAAVPLSAQQMADPNFKSAVERPAYAKRGPRVVIDEAHTNFHTADGRYKPFADLARSDGYQVERGTQKFSRESLRGVRVLVIANALAPEASDEQSAPAFTEAECDAVRDWVHRGGSLLLIADHAPFGSAAETLARRFGVEMGKGFVFDAGNAEPGSPTTLRFSRENGLLGAHAVLEGREATEQIHSVVAFTGQSLSIAAGATPLLVLGASAREGATRADVQAALDGDALKTTSVAGRATGLALRFGKGRVVVFAEAAMFSAQVFRFTDGGVQQERQMGMNVPGTDDRQLALNVLHWLSGLLK